MPNLHKPWCDGEPHDISPAEPADWARPVGWDDIAWQLGYQPSGHVVWSYRGASVFGQPVGICSYGRHIVAAVEAAEAELR